MSDEHDPEDSWCCCIDCLQEEIRRLDEMIALKKIRDAEAKSNPSNSMGLGRGEAK